MSTAAVRAGGSGPSLVHRLLRRRCRCGRRGRVSACARIGPNRTSPSRISRIVLVTEVRSSTPNSCDQKQARWHLATEVGPSTPKSCHQNAAGTFQVTRRRHSSLRTTTGRGRGCATPAPRPRIMCALAYDSRRGRAESRRKAHTSSGLKRFGLPSPRSRPITLLPSIVAPDSMERVPDRAARAWELRATDASRTVERGRERRVAPEPDPAAPSPVGRCGRRGVSRETAASAGPSVVPSWRAGRGRRPCPRR
jgi:hypothetical protein